MTVNAADTAILPAATTMRFPCSAFSGTTKARTSATDWAGASASLTANTTTAAKKDEVIAEILLPFGFGNENFRFLGNMYGGYGNGEYKRYAEGGRFTGDVENYYYGVNNELRGSFDAGFGISLQPTAEFNVAGLYQSGIDDGGLKTGHNNNLSVESGFGLYAEKEFLFNDENSLRLRFGSTWYHEFNDKYQTVKARLDGMEGRFAMDRAEYEKDRGLFSLNGEYRNGGFSFYGETAFEAGRSDNWIFNTGFKYAF